MTGLERNADVVHMATYAPLFAPVSYTHLAGTAHCGLIDAGDGRYFMAHQGRLSPQNQLMDLHVREVFFTVNGWRCV